VVFIPPSLQGETNTCIKHIDVRIFIPLQNDSNCSSTDVLIITEHHEMPRLI